MIILRHVKSLVLLDHRAPKALGPDQFCEVVLGSLRTSGLLEGLKRISVIVCFGAKVLQTSIPHNTPLNWAKGLIPMSVLGHEGPYVLLSLAS